MDVNIEIRTDFENIHNYSTVMLFPNQENPLNTEPHKAHYNSGYFFIEGSSYSGADYYMGDVLKYNDGFVICD